MTSVFETFAADAAQFMGSAIGETVIVTPLGGSPVTLTNVIVHRGQLQTRATDENRRLEEQIWVDIPMANYPGGKPNKGGDTVSIIQRVGDANMSKKTVSAFVSQVGGMWHLLLD